PSWRAACRPPTRAPMEVPAIATISSPRSSSTSITPIWARPRAPPDPSTRPIRGLRPASTGSALVIGQGQLQQRPGLLAQRRRLDDLCVRAVVQHVHQQLARIAVGHLEFEAAVGQMAALLLRMPLLV